jgi:phenylalanine-4-hydroxylase
MDENQHVLFNPNWGTYDMAVGETIVSVFCGAADKDAYEELAHVSQMQTVKITYSASTLKLHEVYQQVRDLRERNIGHKNLAQIFTILKTSFREDWLCSLEILEILDQNQSDEVLSKEINNYLTLKASNEPEIKKLIYDGIVLIKNPVTQLIIQE